MFIDDVMKERIGNILGVVDVWIRMRFDTILGVNDESRLDDRVECIIKMREGIPLPGGLNYIAGDIYTFRGTYRELIGVAEHPAVSYIEGSRLFKQNEKSE